MLERIKSCLTESIQIQIAAAEILPESIAQAAAAIVQSLLNGNKILCCGNGLSAASAQYFSTRLIHHETERPSLPAFALTTDSIALTAIINDNLSDEIYAKQVRAFGHAGDILLVIATRGSHPSLIKAVETAVTRDITIIALSGENDGELAGLMGSQDVEIRIPSQNSAHIQVIQIMVLNCLSDLIDYRLFKSSESPGV